MCVCTRVHVVCVWGEEEDWTTRQRDVRRLESFHLLCVRSILKVNRGRQLDKHISLQVVGCGEIWGRSRIKSESADFDGSATCPACQIVSLVSCCTAHYRPNAHRLDPVSVGRTSRSAAWWLSAFLCSSMVTLSRIDKDGGSPAVTLSMLSSGPAWSLW